MSFALGAIPVAVAGSALGAKTAQLLGGLLGGNGSQQSPVTTAVDQANKVLKKSLTQALNYSQNYTNTGLGNLTDYMNQAQGSLTNYLQQATSQAQSNVNQGLTSSMATNAPIVQTGYNALDKYEDSLGIARPSMGNAAYASALQQASNFFGGAGGSDFNSLQQQLMQNAQTLGYSNPYGSNASPNAPDLSSYANQVSQNQIQQLLGNTSSNALSAEYYGDKGKYLGTAIDPTKNPNAINYPAAAWDSTFSQENQALGAQGITNPTEQQDFSQYVQQSIANLKARGDSPADIARNISATLTYGQPILPQYLTNSKQTSPKATSLFGQYDAAYNSPVNISGLANSTYGSLLANINNSQNQTALKNYIASQPGTAYSTALNNYNTVLNPASQAYQSAYNQLQQQLNGLGGAVQTGLAAQQGLFGPVQIV